MAAMKRALMEARERMEEAVNALATGRPPEFVLNAIEEECRRLRALCSAPPNVGHITIIGDASLQSTQYPKAGPAVIVIETHGEVDIRCDGDVRIGTLAGVPSPGSASVDARDGPRLFYAAGGNHVTFRGHPVSVSTEVRTVYLANAAHVVPEDVATAFASLLYDRAGNPSPIELDEVPEWG